MFSILNQYFFLLSFLFWICGLEASCSLRLLQIDCTTLNEELIKVNECGVNTVENGDPSLNLNATFLQTINTIKMKGSFRRDGTSNQPTTVIDVCKYLAEGSMGFWNGVGRMVFKHLNQNSNFQHQCPYKGFAVEQKLNMKCNIMLSMLVKKGIYRFEAIWILNGVESLKTFGQLEVLS